MIFDEKPSLKVRGVMIIILVMVAFAVYGNTLTNGFVYDDEYQVLKNPWIKDISSLPKVFSSEVWGFRGDSISNYYRPLLHVTYMIGYHLFGYQAWGYHAINILLHGAITVMVFLLIQSLLVKMNGKYAFIASLAAAMAFALHPIHTEVVAPVMSVTDLLLTLFYVSALYLHIRFSDRPWYYSLAPALLFGLALLSKEIAITLPFVCLTYDILFAEKTSLLWRRAVRYAPYLAVTLLYLAVRGSVLGSFVPIDRHPDLSTTQIILNIFPLAVKYGSKLLVPVDLNAMYEFHPVRSIVEPRAFLSILMVVTVLALACKVVRRSKTTAFGLALIVIPLLPAFYIRAIPYPFAERYLYLPSVGLAIIIADLVSRYVMTARAARTFMVLIPILLCFYGVGTVRRNGVWKDNYTLWSDTVSKSPDNAIVRCNLGEALKSRGRMLEAIEQIRIATELDPNSEFFRKLGTAYYDAGNRGEALRQYERAVSLEPTDAMARNDLGSLYGEMGDFTRAIVHLEAAIRLKPAQADSHYNLGMAYRDAGLLDKALEQFDAAARIVPTDPVYRNSLAETWRMRNMLK